MLVIFLKQKRMLQYMGIPFKVYSYLMLIVPRRGFGSTTIKRILKVDE